MKEQNNGLIIGLIVLIVVIFFSGFGMMGFSGMRMYGMMGYGSNYLCSNIGGIWCYIPIFGFLFMSLFWIVMILLVVWIVKQIQKSNNGNKK